ncbi:dihydrolipoyl dehydrogenase family protein [Thalassobacillus hwangdonensis]|uniref:Dihydrolipoyl dehydrogenase family protein n=1 Tax=Thalassobacillus hwangdonensis TaxID=546108 RepID=A0ABW3KVT1_9BACI
MSKDYQIIVIGGGSGGLTVAAGAASFGAKVALIERKSSLGGDCLHYGCMPSKALIHGAEEIHQVATYESLSSKAYDSYFSKTMARVSEAVKDVQHHDSKDRFLDMGVDIYESEARFVDSHRIQVGNEIISGKRIVIATGSSPFIPPIDGLDSVDFLTNESVFSLTERPEKLAVIGGGVIGIELSQALSRLGVEVTVLEGAPSILASEDEEITSIAEELLNEELTILTNAKVKQVEEADGKTVLTYEQNGNEQRLEVDQILVATGRKANIDRLNLSAAGVYVTDGKIDVDSTMQTSQPHIYAVGDCNGSMPFTHVAGMEGKIVVSNAVFGLKRKASYKKVPWVVYSSPEIYHLGMTEKEARDQYGDDLLVFKTKLADNDRFMAERNTAGLVKVMTKGNGKIVGAHAIGPGAGEWMQEVGTVQALNKKFQAISNIIHPYPARNNIVSQTSDLYWREKLFDSKLNDAIRWYVKKFR